MSVLQYLVEIVDYTLHYGILKIQLHGFKDIDCVGDLEERKHFSMCFVELGHAFLEMQEKRDNCLIYNGG